MDQENPGSVDLLKRELGKLHAQLAELRKTLSGLNEGAEKKSATAPIGAASPVAEQADASVPAGATFCANLLQHVPAMVYSIPMSDQQTAYFSPQTGAITGIDAAEWSRRHGLWAQCVHPDDRVFVMAEIARAFATGRALSLEYRLVRPDGRIVWLRDQASVARDDDGNPLALRGVAVDITDLKEARASLPAAQRDGDEALREVHRGMKNNLQVVAGMLELRSARTIELPRILRDSRNRIDALGFLHQSLIRSASPDLVDLLPYLDALTAHLYDSFAVDVRRVRRELDASAPQVGFDTAVRVGLVINELVSNALEHAFPDNATGRIAICVRAEGEGLAVEVSDDGIGLPRDPDLDQIETPGLRLVVTLARQVGGRVLLYRNPDTRFAVSLPVECIR